MAKKKTEEKTVHRPADPNVMGLRGTVVEQPITRTLDENYMPYAMSVIVSRAIPEIDGFKPSHRKLLYTMYKMGLLTGGRTKSANIVGQTMRLNPHGDQAIYETMVRLAKGNESLLHPFVDSKGNFGKVYSRDMAYAASRYTEAKLAPICAELFRDLDCDAVDFVDNYDNTTKEPTLLPTTYPNVLVSANQGIAVGMASQICGFNLAEVCDTTIALLKNPDHDIASTLLAPDFPTGGQLVCDPAKLGMDESESVVYMVLPGDYSGHLLFFFENGKIARVEMKAYATVSNRRKLTGAYSDKSRLVAILPLAEDRELALLSTEPRALIFHTSLLLPKATRSTQGVAVMTLKPKYQLQRVCTPEESGIVNLPRYRARSIPGTGALLRPEDRGEEQLTLL